MLHRLVEAGKTVVVIEHNLDIIAEADWIIDLGQEGGDSGGRIVVQGTPEQCSAAVGRSHTAAHLKGFFARSGARVRHVLPGGKWDEWATIPMSGNM